MPTYQDPAPQNDAETDEEKTIENDKNIKVEDKHTVENSADEVECDDTLDAPPYIKEEKNGDEKEIEEYQNENGEGPNGETKPSLPSIKAIQKDRTKNASVVEKHHKMLLLVEILQLLQTYKAHTFENKFAQWNIVQDQLHQQEIGSMYRKMDKAYCFRKKVLNAIDSWIDWARIRGYPEPQSVRKYASNTWKFPPFLELLYKTYNEIKDTKTGNWNNVYRSSAVEKKDDNQQDESDEESNHSSNSKAEEASAKPSSEIELDETIVDDSIPVASAIIRNNKELANSSAMKSYLQDAASLQKAKAEIFQLKRSALQAELDDMDISRLETIEAKMMNYMSGTTLHKEYCRQRDRCIARLERSE